MTRSKETEPPSANSRAKHQRAKAFAAAATVESSPGENDENRTERRRSGRGAALAEIEDNSVATTRTDRRRSGRAANQQISAPPEFPSASEAEAEMESPPKKRKRGRPPKEPRDENDNQVEAQPPKRRGRGRPPKNKPLRDVPEPLDVLKNTAIVPSIRRKQGVLIKKAVIRGKDKELIIFPNNPIPVIFRPDYTTNWGIAVAVSLSQAYKCENFCFSPLAAQVAFGILHAGTKPEDKISQLMEAQLARDGITDWISFQEAMAKVSKEIHAASENEEAFLMTNKLLLKNSENLSDRFREICHDKFDGVIGELTDKKELKKMIDKMNTDLQDWTDNNFVNTHEFDVKYIQLDAVNLMSSFFFGAFFNKTFRTVRGPFYTDMGISCFHGKNGENYVFVPETYIEGRLEIGYSQAELWRMMEIPLKNSQVAFRIFMRIHDRYKGSFQKTKEQLTNELFKKLIQEKVSVQAEVRIPKFTQDSVFGWEMFFENTEVVCDKWEDFAELGSKNVNLKHHTSIKITEFGVNGNETVENAFNEETDEPPQYGIMNFHANEPFFYALTVGTEPILFGQYGAGLKPPPPAPPSVDTAESQTVVNLPKIRKNTIRRPPNYFTDKASQKEEEESENEEEKPKNEEEEPQNVKEESQNVIEKPKRGRKIVQLPPESSLNEEIQPVGERSQRSQRNVKPRPPPETISFSDEDNDFVEKTPRKARRKRRS